MRIPRLSISLVILISLTSGCAQTGWLRPGSAGTSTAPNMRTVASVGDKPLPIVSGAPGSSFRSFDR